MAFKVEKATRKKSKLRIGITGPSGSGKTTAALTIATVFGKTCYMDTERGSASLYADRFEFDVCNMERPFDPESFIEGIEYAENNGYDIAVIDSYSHVWSYCLDMVSKSTDTNSYAAWRTITPRWEKLINKMLESKIHIICCMRSKTEYVIEMNEKGKQMPKKMGMAATVREGLEYEFTTVFDLNQNHIAHQSKDRTGLFGDKQFEITVNVAKAMIEWLDKGIELAPEPKTITSPKDIEALPIVQEAKERLGLQTLDEIKVEVQDLINAVSEIPKLTEIFNEYKSNPDLLEWLKLACGDRKKIILS